MKKKNLTYSKKVMKHFMNPKNAGKMKNPDSVGSNENDRCGDVMKIYLKIGEKRLGKNKKPYIKNIKFQTLGCPAAIATSDVLCDLVRGKTLKEAKKVNKKDIIKGLGNLPPIKVHCSLLGDRTLKKAIENYEKKNGRKS